MSQPGRQSNCSSGLPVDFFWHACPGECELSRHVDAMTEALMCVVKAPANRRWNPYAEVYAQREFRSRLSAASRGELVPVDHVKSIDHPLASEMFEIRWQYVQVTETGDDGRLRHRAIQVRLLHVEPLELGVVAVGLHAHEKQVIPRDPRKTRQLQDAEIVEAVRIYGLAGPQWLRKSPAGGLHRDTGEQ